MLPGKDQERESLGRNCRWNWALMGKLSAMTLDIENSIRHVMELHGVGAEILDWVTSDEKGRLALNRAALGLCKEYKKFWAQTTFEQDNITDLNYQSVLPIEIPFRVSDYFTEGVHGTHEVRVYSVDALFDSWFGKKIEKVRMDHLCMNRFRFKSPVRGSEIVSVLNSTSDMLSSIWALLCLQPIGEEGILLNDGGENMFLVESCQPGDIKIVSVRWNQRGWCFKTHHPFSNELNTFGPDTNADDRFFSSFNPLV